MVLVQLAGLAVSTVLFPELATLLAGGQVAKARASLAGAMRLVWLIALPSSVAMILLREPIVRLLFRRGAFDTRPRRPSAVHWPGTRSHTCSMPFASRSGG